ncbi:MAG: hypothetical protein JST00_47830 [Deltaproteobacteria bacterium]|nr:hypothetical protein [Deltaproteobacteria bacterium]
MARSSFFVLSLALLAAACAAPIEGSSEEVDASEDELRTSYGSLGETLGGADLDRWFDVRKKLIAGFDDICGDTICSGDYSNLTTVRLECSSTRAARKMKDCLWVLAGNIDFVDGRTGKLTSTIRTFACHVPVGSNAKTFVSTLGAAGDRALTTTIPGTDKTFYDALVTCFDGVVGPPPPNASQTFYSELSDHLWSQGDAAGLGWLETKRKLVSSFDDVCGDTFCEGDYSDIVGLRLACSVNENTKRVSRCGWSFAGADLSVDSRGAISARTFTRRCDFAVGVPTTQLTSALSGTDPLRARLPNRTTSIYDALVGCL